MQIYLHMKNSIINSFFEQPGLLKSFDDVVSNVIDCSVDAYKYRTTLNEQDGVYKIVSQVPGLTKDDIVITVENGVLKINGEKEINANMVSSIHKEFRLGNDINTSKIAASVQDGILEVEIPKSEHKKAKQIKIS